MHSYDIILHCFGKREATQASMRGHGMEQYSLNNKYYHLLFHIFNPLHGQMVIYENFKQLEKIQTKKKTLNTVSGICCSVLAFTG